MAGVLQDSGRGDLPPGAAPGGAEGAAGAGGQAAAPPSTPPSTRVSDPLSAPSAAPPSAPLSAPPSTRPSAPLSAPLPPSPVPTTGRALPAPRGELGVRRLPTPLHLWVVASLTPFCCAPRALRWWRVLEGQQGTARGWQTGCPGPCGTSSAKWRRISGTCWSSECPQSGAGGTRARSRSPNPPPGPPRYEHFKSLPESQSLEQLSLAESGSQGEVDAPTAGDGGPSKVPCRTRSLEEGPTLETLPL